MIGLLVGLGGRPAAARADQAVELAALKRQVGEQQATIQQLVARLTQLEGRLDSPAGSPPSGGGRADLSGAELAALPQGAVQGSTTGPTVQIGGYVDIGYVDAAGAGTVSTSALQINSRGDTLANVGLDGDASFLVNEVNLDVQAQVSPQWAAVMNLAFLPRKLSITASEGTPTTDSFEVNTAYVAYRPFTESNALTDTLFGDLMLSAGKFDSPFGLEYHYNKSPDRVNISRSMMSIYWTGYPVGVKAHGQLFKEGLDRFRHSALTYNVVLANGEPWLNEFVDVDRATNSRKDIMGRLSYGLNVFGGFFESGASMAYGPRINQGDNATLADSFDADARWERGPLTLRFEYDYSNGDAPRTGGQGFEFSHTYYEGFYEIARPQWWPRWMPMRSLTPYYRYDTRDRNTTTTTGYPTPTTQKIRRHTFALRYLLRSGTIFKGEYQVVDEAEEASVNDNVFLMSFVQQF